MSNPTAKQLRAKAHEYAATGQGSISSYRRTSMSKPKAIVVPTVGNTFRVRIGTFVFDQVFRSEAAAKKFAAKVVVSNFTKEQA